MTDENYESKSRLDRMIHDNKLYKKFFTAADVLTFIEIERNKVRASIGTNHERNIIDGAFAILQSELCDEAPILPFKYPQYKDVTYSLDEINDLIREKRETIVNDICLRFAKSSKRSKNRTIDIVIQTLSLLQRYVTIDYDARLINFAQSFKVGTLTSKESYYDPNSLYPSDTDNDAVKVASKDVTIDAPTVTITITQKETNK